MVKVAVFLSVVAVCGVVSGCDDPPPVPSVDSVCDGICQGAHRCDSRVLVGSCYASCRTDPRNQTLAYLQPEAGAVISACLAQLDCSAIDNSRFDSCWERAREEEDRAPSAHLLAFCPPYATSAFECGYWLSVEDCQVQFNIYTDQFLDAAAACTHEATCAATDTCLTNLFGGG